MTRLIKWFVLRFDNCELLRVVVLYINLNTYNFHDIISRYSIFSKEGVKLGRIKNSGSLFYAQH